MANPITAPQGVNLPPPPLPGVGVKQPTKAEREAYTANLQELRDAPKSLAKLVLFLEKHPEITEWARHIVSGK